MGLRKKFMDWLTAQVQSVLFSSYRVYVSLCKESGQDLNRIVDEDTFCALVRDEMKGERSCPRLSE